MMTLRQATASANTQYGTVCYFLHLRQYGFTQMVNGTWEIAPQLSTNMETVTCIRRAKVRARARIILIAANV